MRWRYALLLTLAAWFLVSGAAFCQIVYSVTPGGTYQPLNGATIRGKINVRAPCASGATTFGLDGVVRNTEQNAPCAFIDDNALWDSASVPDGTHSISATGQTPASFTVANVVTIPPPPPATEPPPTTFKLRKPGCYLDALAYAYQFTNPGAIVWWCDESVGVVRYWRTWSQIEQPHLPSADPEIIWSADQAAFTRASTDSEMTVVNALSTRRGPHLLTQTSGTATTVPVYSRNPDGTRGVQRRDSKALPMTIAPGVPVGFLRLAGVTTRYCDVAGYQSVSAETIPADSWAKCTIQLAPATGW